MSRPFQHDVCVVGGCGHVGLPLAIALADAGLSVAVYDIDSDTVDQVLRGEMPFAEEGAEPVLRRALADGTLTVTDDPEIVGSAESVVVVIGTPIDRHLNPEPMAVPEAVLALADHLVDGQLVVLRSTVFPGVTALVESMVSKLPVDVEVAFCPERIAQGHAMTELRTLPQIVAARSDAALARAEKLFRHLAPRTIALSPEEAELAKLFTNAWRYVKFAAANQLFMIANDAGVDFERVRWAMGEDYPRAADLPGAGFAAGPCLLKDTMQLAAYKNNDFALGQSAMMVNEGLPLYMVSRLDQKYGLADKVVGILGMAFKAESDDTRSSLSYKLRMILEFRARDVLTTDPYVTNDDRLLPFEEVVARSDLLIIGAPHQRYQGLDTSVPVVDIWNLTGNGALL